jgi:hypothetical protein
MKTRNAKEKSKTVGKHKKLAGDKLQNHAQETPKGDTEATHQVSVRPHVRGTSMVVEKSEEDGVVKKIMRSSDGDIFDFSKMMPDKIKEQICEKINTICKETSGSEDINVTATVLNLVQGGMLGGSYLDRTNRIASVLPLLEPKNPAEALLAAQFANLQQAGFRCLEQANNAGDSGDRIEFFNTQATKLLRLANETMQTLVRYRTAGQQVVQVIHVTNNGQAIVAQNLSQTPGGGCSSQNQGGTPCNTNNAAQNAVEPVKVSHVKQDPLPVQQDVECMEERVRVHPKKAVSA